MIRTIIAVALLLRAVFLWANILFDKKKRSLCNILKMVLCFIASWAIAILMFRFYHAEGIGYICFYIIGMGTIGYVSVLLMITAYVFAAELAMSDEDWYNKGEDEQDDKTE